MRTRHSTRRDERGFALLVVFLLAAGIMISLYLELPRVGFESQRNREEMLIERGEQYQRAIELFYRKNKRYPQKIEDLESFNNLRFLRKRYVDPLTGKDEWRMVHMGPAGQLADSLVEKPGQAPGQQLAGVAGTVQPVAAATPPTGPAGTNGAPGDTDFNLAQNRIRQSDRNPGGRGALTAGSLGYDPNNPNGQQPNADPNNPFNANNPGFNQNNNPDFNQNANNPGFNASQPQNGNLPPNPGFQQNANFQTQPSFQNQNGVNPNGVQPGSPGQSPFIQNGAPPFSPGALLQSQIGNQNGYNPNTAGFPTNPALNAINNQLRNQTGFPQQNTGGYGQSGYGAPPGDTNYQIPPGGARLPDGSIRLPNGSIIDKNGNLIPADGAPKPPANPAFGSVQTPGFGTTQPTTSGLGQPSGFGTPAATSQPGGQTFGGGGIAGVASNQPGLGIKRYNERAKYKEWEFVYDYRKPKGKAVTGIATQTQPPNSQSRPTSTSGFGK